MSILDWTWNQVFDGAAAKFTALMNSSLGKFVVKAMAFLGIEITSYEQIVGPAVDNARAAWTGLPGSLMVWIDALRIDQVVTIILSAYTIAFLKKITFGRVVGGTP